MVNKLPIQSTLNIFLAITYHSVKKTKRFGFILSILSYIHVHVIKQSSLSQGD